MFVALVTAESNKKFDHVPKCHAFHCRVYWTVLLVECGVIKATGVDFLSLLMHLGVRLECRKYDQLYEPHDCPPRKDD